MANNTSTIFDRVLEFTNLKKKSKEVDFTNVNNSSINFCKIQPFSIFGCTTGQYSTFYLQIVLNKIFEGLRNLRFYSQTENTEINKIAQFLNLNGTNLLYNLWSFGYMVIDKTNNNYNMVDYQNVKVDINGEVKEPIGSEWVVYYSTEYLQKRKTLFQIIKPQLDSIDIYQNAQNYLTQTYGSVAIMHGKQLAISPQEKKNIEEGFKNNLGISKDKSQFIITNSDLDVNQIQFDVEALKLENKIDTSFKRICSYFGVPVNLLYTDENSTYDNQAESRRRFYHSCITNFGEELLTLGRGVIKNNLNLLIMSDDLTFVFDNIKTQDEQLDDIQKMINIYNQLDGIADREKILTKIQDSIISL